MKFTRPHLRPLSVRVQLMLWFTSVFALLLFSYGLLLYKHLADRLADSVDSTLQIQAQQIADDIHETKGTIKLDGVAHDLPHPGATISSQELPASALTFGPLVRVLDAQGNPLRETPAFSTLQVPADSITLALRGPYWEGTITTQDGQFVRLYSQVFRKGNNTLVIIQVAHSLDELHDTLADLTKELLVVGVIFLGCSAIGSYWLASRAFRPIHRLIETARAIKAGDLHQRVPVPRAHDEVHFLAVTLNEMIGRLDEMFERQRRFVADASHELRTPIAAIRSKTDVALMQTDLPTEYSTVLQDINEETVRLSRLIKDLLALARSDEGQIQVAQEAVRLDTLAQMVVEHAEPLADEQQVTLQVRATNPVTVTGDETRLMQTIINLVDNAVHYNQPGGSVIVTVESVQKQACLIVQDTGRGITPEHLPHIFERFYRGDPAHGRTERGSSGLGLSIVEWIVRAHKGTITVDSQVGRGTTFVVTLPLAVGSASVAPTATRTLVAGRG